MEKQININTIIIHCSATQENKHYTVSDIDRWHKERGFDEIGYHYVIYLDGSLHNGRDINMVGAHCKGYNKGSIGICYIGGLDNNNRSKDTRNQQQKNALNDLVKKLQKKYLINKKNIFGHNELNSKKDCPCFNVKSEFRMI